MLLWIIGIIVILTLTLAGFGVYYYQKYHNVNAQITEKDAIIATQTTIIEGNQKTIEANNKEIYLSHARYDKLKDALIQKAKENEAVQKPVGEKAITDCIEKHGFKVGVKK